MKKFSAILASLCVLVGTSALAGGPEYPPPLQIQGLDIGLGMTFPYAIHRMYFMQFSSRLAVDNFRTIDVGANQTYAIGEIGYTFPIRQTGFIGVKGLILYAGRELTSALGESTLEIMLKYRASGLVFGGIRIDKADLAYLEAGYTGAAMTFLADFLAFGGRDGSMRMADWVQGGTAGVGYRHYFHYNFFVDLSGTYTLLQHTPGLEISGFQPSTTPFIAGFTGIRRFQIIDLEATINYLFLI